MNLELEAKIRRYKARKYTTIPEDFDKHADLFNVPPLSPLARAISIGCMIAAGLIGLYIIGNS